MAGIRCALVILQVASYAGRAVQRVVVVEVAIGALPGRYRVQARQRKAGRGVVKLAISPLHGVMALLTRGGEAGMGHGCVGVVVSGLMATDAGRAGDAVIVVDVTVAALPRRHHVGAIQRKSRFRVIECRRLPGRGVVAGVASFRKSARDVVRVRGVLKILEMARYASARRQVVVVVGVAIAALPRWDRMSAGQCKVHHRVVEARRGPCNRGMALRTIRWEIGRDMTRVRRFLKIWQVATNTGHTRQAIVVVSVAVGALAGRHRVRIG